MKLVRFSLFDRFRSLPKGFNVTFREEYALAEKEINQFHPFCFAGLNGSGKSNVLEALAEIFNHLECCTFPEDITTLIDDQKNFKKEVCQPDAFELEYLIVQQGKENPTFNDYVRVVIKKESKKKPQIRFGTNDYVDLTHSIKSYLPELVIGYSSGENQILNLPFLRAKMLQFEEYLYSLDKSDLVFNKPETSLTYMDYEMSQAILVTNFLMQNEATLEPIKNVLNIEKFYGFRIVINDIGYKGEKKEYESLLNKLNKHINSLKKLATCYYKDGKSLHLDYYINDDTKTAFQDCFKSPIELFRVFQILSILNLRGFKPNSLKEVFTSNSLYADQKINSERSVFYFNKFLIKKNEMKKPMLVRSFSDGEHQFLHSMGICLLLKNKSALLLLDEPETHFNPDWRSRFISILKDSLEKGGSNNIMRDILITSHSPFIISDCFPDKVIVFQNGQDPQNAKDMRFNTFGTSVNIVLEEIFKKEESIPQYSFEELNKIKNRVFNTLEEIQQAKEDARILGESPEKVFLFRHLILKEEEIKANKN